MNTTNLLTFSNPEIVGQIDSQHYGEFIYSGGLELKWMETNIKISVDSLLDSQEHFGVKNGDLDSGLPHLETGNATTLMKDAHQCSLFVLEAKSLDKMDKIPMLHLSIFSVNISEYDSLSLNEEISCLDTISEFIQENKVLTFESLREPIDTVNVEGVSTLLQNCSQQKGNIVQHPLKEYHETRERKDTNVLEKAPEKGKKSDTVLTIPLSQPSMTASSVPMERSNEIAIYENNHRIEHKQKEFFGVQPYFGNTITVSPEVLGRLPRVDEREDEEREEEKVFIDSSVISNTDEIPQNSLINQRWLQAHTKDETPYFYNIISGESRWSLDPESSLDVIYLTENQNEVDGSILSLSEEKGTLQFNTGDDPSLLYLAKETKDQQTMAFQNFSDKASDFSAKNEYFSTYFPFPLDDGLTTRKMSDLIEQIIDCGITDAEIDQLIQLLPRKLLLSPIDGFGNTIVHHIITHRRSACLSTLLQVVLNCNTEYFDTKEGYRLEQVYWKATIEERSKKCISEAISLLSACNSDGQTALHTACMIGDVYAASRIIQAVQVAGKYDIDQIEGLEGQEFGLCSTIPINGNLAASLTTNETLNQNMMPTSQNLTIHNNCAHDQPCECKKNENQVEIQVESKENHEKCTITNDSLAFCDPIPLRILLLVDTQDNAGNVALHYASSTNVDCTNLLLKYGASCGISDYAGNTALHFAVWANREDIVNILLVAVSSTGYLE